MDTALAGLEFLIEALVRLSYQTSLENSLSINADVFCRLQHRASGSAGPFVFVRFRSRLKLIGPFQCDGSSDPRSDGVF